MALHVKRMPFRLMKKWLSSQKKSTKFHFSKHDYEEEKRLSPHKRESILKITLKESYFFLSQCALFKSVWLVRIVHYIGSVQVEHADVKSRKGLDIAKEFLDWIYHRPVLILAEKTELTDKRRAR